MNGNPNTIQAIAKLDRENEVLRARLSRHEFRKMERELASEDVFRLDVHASAVDTPPALAVPAIGDALLPRLPVPSGSIQRERLSHRLPAVAIHDGGLRGRALALALTGLFKAQYRAPFARLVFLCSSFDAVPFLGRYGYAVEHLGQTDPVTQLSRLQRRYGVTQIRSIGSGELIAERPPGE